MNKCDRVAALVANKQSKFGKEVLETWSEADLETLQQSLSAHVEAAPVVVNTVTQPVANAEVAELRAEIQKVAALVGQMAQAVTANADREKAGLVAEIVANSQLGEADLTVMSVEQLRKLAASLLPRDYSGGAGVFRSNSNEDEEYVMPMPTVWPVAGEGK